MLKIIARKVGKETYGGQWFIWFTWIP